MSISLCMIVKNEEKYLEQCLDSVKDLIDEIIIVDTGSQDKTIKIAQKFTSKIYHFQWSNDFSKARNESLKHATKDWVLFLDADEIINKKDHQKIKELTQNTDILGFSFIVRNYTNSDSASNWTSSKNDPYPESQKAAGWFANDHIRLFKNHQNIFFEGVIHETIGQSIPHKKIKKTSIPIHHFGHLQNKNKQFYTELTHQKAEQTNNFHSYYQLGRQLLANNNPTEAIQALRKSIQLNQQFPNAWLCLGVAYLNTNQIKLAEKALINTIQLNPDNSSAHNNLGIIYAQLKDFDKATNHFKKAISLSPKSATFYKNLGSAYRQSQQHQLAKQAFQKALELNPHLKRYIQLK